MVLFPCFYSIVVTHRNRIFPLLFHCFTRALRDNGPTSEPQFFHCFSTPSISILLLLFYLESFSKRSTQIFHSFPIVLYAINLFFHFINFPVFCHGVTRFLHHYPYVTPVCLTLTQVHLPQSLQLHRINGFARFFHGFLSVLLLHSGHTSKLQFFHCFSIVSRVLYAIMVPHRSLNFTWHHFTLSLFFPPFLLAF